MPQPCAFQDEHCRAGRCPICGPPREVPRGDEEKRARLLAMAEEPWPWDDEDRERFRQAAGGIR